MYGTNYDFDELDLPPPPSHAAPKPPRRVSTIMMPTSNPVIGEEVKPAMMRRLSRVLNTRRVSKEKKELERDAAEADIASTCHFDAFNGRIAAVQRAINKDPNVVNQYFKYSPKSLLTEAEMKNEYYLPPPPLPKLIKLTLKKTVETMTLDQRWLMSNAFANSTLLHYACAGDQLEVVKLLLEKGADWELVNAVNKTADTYTISDEIRELFVDAHAKYKPLPQVIRGKPKAEETKSDVYVEPAPAPASVLKPATTGRRRQSVVNDSSWADSNLRNVVHQTQAPSIRGSTIMAYPTTAPPPVPRRTLGGSFRRPDEDVPDEDDEGPITMVPMSFMSSPSPKTTTSVTNTATSYSAAASVKSGMSGLEYGAAPDFAGDDVSVASHGTGTTGNGSYASAGAGTKMNARRRSRVLSAMRLRETGSDQSPAPVPAPAASAPAAAVSKSHLPSRRAASRSPQKQAVKSSADNSGGMSRSPVRERASKVSASEAGPAPAPSSSPVKSRTPAGAENSGKTQEEVVCPDIGPAEKAGANKPKLKKAASSKKVTEEAVATASKKKLARTEDSERGEGVSKAQAESQNKESRVNSSPIRRKVPPPPATSSAGGEAAAVKEVPMMKLPTAAAPPLRVMRRLSVNMAQSALEDVSYIEGAQGERQIVAQSIVPAADLGAERDRAEGTAPSAVTKPGLHSLFPGPSGASSVDTARDSAKSNALPIPPPGPPAEADSSAQKKKAALEFVAESGEDAFLEAWECKATDQSPFARLQNSLLSGKNAQQNVEEATALIARVKQLEKQEAREARLLEARAEKLQQMMSKLTPLENIASGVLRGMESGGAVSDLFRGQHAESGAEEGGEDGNAESDAKEDGGLAKQASDFFGSGQAQAEHSAEHKDDTERAPHPHGSPAVPVGSPSRQSLTFRDLIWRRAGYHLNSALSDAHKGDYDRARMEAYQLGVKLLKREFQEYAYKERWEAVELVEEQRIANADMYLKASARVMAMNSSSRDRAEEAVVDRSNRQDSFVPFSSHSAAHVDVADEDASDEEWRS